MVTRVGNYHKNCFSCIDCNKKLDSTTCCEGKGIYSSEILSICHFLVGFQDQTKRFIVNPVIRLILVPRLEQNQKERQQSRAGL